MKRILNLSVLAALAASVLFFACPGQKGDTKIGVILPLTGGDFASLGEDCRNGITLAAEEFNKTGKIHVALLFEDSQGNPDAAVSAFNKLRAQGVVAVIGDLFSAPTLAIAPLAEKYKLLTFSPGASNPKLSGASKYVFRNYPSDNYEGKLLASYLRDSEGITRVAVLYPTNDYGVGLKDVFSNRYESLGGKVVLSEGYADNETSFRDILSKVLRAMPEALYLPGYYGPIARIAVQAKQLGLRLPMYSNVGVEDPKVFALGGDAIEGLTYTAPAVDLTSQDSTIQGFVSAYKAKYNKDPGFPAAHGFDTGNILFSLLVSKGTNSDSIRAGLMQSSFSGVTGTMKFDARGDVYKPFLLKRIVDGRFVSVGTLD
jgi:branched-chain amino acid transport system substrate-binding protein